jgi:beta-glucosidase
LDRAEALARQVSTVVLVVGTTAESEREGGDRASMDLPGEQNQLIRRVLAANPRTVVVVNAGSPVAMPWVEEAPAVLSAWFPGQQGDEALADVLFGDADPGGRLPVTLPVRVEDCPAHLTYPGEAGTVDYADGVFVGYRGYDRRAVTALFPFGHGLSYTSFDLGPMGLGAEEFEPGDTVTVSVAVTNTGPRAGSQVVQVYVHDRESTLLRPELELKGFAKVQLAPGQRTEVEIALPPRAFAAWDPVRHGWVVEPGLFEVVVATSCRAIHERRTLTCLGDAPVTLP